ncbi:AraC family transcriptional regulator [Chitinophaga defluvii]|uniref:AraC family transcriptional regulator n=1 Tax=Chitinophaga defluvii TaxID=3163343 RepID=A0ABV2SZ08_9BACT
MKAIEQRLPQDFDKSFVVFRETGVFFPCPWHYHPEYELVLVTKSTGRRMVGDHIGYFEEEDLVFMGPMLPHVWVNDPEYINGTSDAKADAVVIHFSEHFLGESFMGIPEMEPFQKFLKPANQGIVIKGDTRNRINALMKAMLSMNGLQRLSALFTIFDLLANTTEYELLASPGFVQANHFNVSDRFSKVTEYIMRNFDRDITLPEIAGLANMALTTFCNFFKEHYRVTFVEYLTNVRIGYACKLISEKDQSIAEVAYECGFNNLANFNRQFKKLKKMTPREYKQTLNA